MSILPDGNGTEDDEGLEDDDDAEYIANYEYDMSTNTLCEANGRVLKHKAFQYMYLIEALLSEHRYADKA
jgi:hypothetical protein